MNRSLFKQLCPPILKKPFKGFAGSVRWRGDFPDWQTAAKKCPGYDAPQIAQNVLEKTLAVLDGSAAFERDGVAFPEPEYNWPALACLLSSISVSQAGCGVMDFGGALGSFLHQHRQFLLGRISDWHVVEQPHYVALGKAHIRVEGLHFHDSIGACLRKATPSVALLSSVIQYLPDPWKIINEVSSGPLSHLLVDRTPFAFRSTDRLTVQRVSSAICKSGYPCRYLSHTGFLERLSVHWDILAEWDDVIDSSNLHGCEFRGMYFKRHHV
jgi:putative methyltransferase (TIGR04325 family)